jgi:phosphatidylglycerophosphate synthase
MTSQAPPAASGEGADTGPLPAGPVARLHAAALVAALALPLLGYVLVGAAPGALALAMAGYLCAVVLVTALMRRAYPYEDLGLGNLVTLARLVLASALLAPLVAPGAPWAVVVLALLALALDGIDGWLARRQGRVSQFGARFDMEVDAALGLILALNALAAGSAGPAVLLLGLPRYAFAAAARAWPWLARPLPERAGRKVVCVVQIGALIALQLPALPGPAAGALVGATLTALGWSFGRDVLWLRRAGP